MIEQQGVSHMFMREIINLSSVERDILVEVARAIVPFEKEIAVRWHDLYSASRTVHQTRGRTARSFRYAVRMLLTSLAAGDFDVYMKRIQKAGVAFARTKEKYENLIAFFHFYEEAVTPFLWEVFPGKIDVVLRTLEHLYHGIVALLSRAYFMELEKNRDRFLGTLVHDLQNPLSGMTGFAQIMMEKSVPKGKDAKMLRIIRDSGEKMSSLIDHALTYGRLNSGKAFLILSDVDIAEIAREAATVLIPEVEKRSLSISINKEQQKNWEFLPPVIARADRELLLRAVGNYLSNAVKHAKTRIEVTVEGREEDVLIEVRDDGPGIPSDKLLQVFENYYVVPGGKPGIGIGLASVRMIADMHKGKAWVESSRGKGSAFSFLLPGRRKSAERY
jgi:signal transduction histidine kinase